MSSNKRDLSSRGIRGSSPLGTGTFILLRTLEPLLQLQLLRHPTLLPGTILPLLRFHGPLPPPPSHYLTTSPLITTLGLNLPPFATLLFLLCVAASTKQIFWLVYTSKEIMHPSGAAAIALFNALVNTVNIALFSFASLNPTYSVPSCMYLGLSLFSVGIVVEAMAEVQRKWFKDDVRNEGKMYAGGLFGWARNINYGAYTLWRTGFALAAGGWVWGGLIFGVSCWDFSTRAVPVMEDYCRKRYGRQWEEVERKVQYRLFPGVY